MHTPGTEHQAAPGSTLGVFILLTDRHGPQKGNPVELKRASLRRSFFHQSVSRFSRQNETNNFQHPHMLLLELCIGCSQSSHFLHFFVPSTLFLPPSDRGSVITPALRCTSVPRTGTEAQTSRGRERIKGTELGDAVEGGDLSRAEVVPGSRQAPAEGSALARRGQVLKGAGGGRRSSKRVVNHPEPV